MHTHVHTVSTCPNPINDEVCTSVAPYDARMIFSGETTWRKCITSSTLCHPHRRGLLPSLHQRLQSTLFTVE